MGAMDIQDQVLIAALDAFSRARRDSFKPFPPMRSFDTRVIAKIKESPESPNRQITNARAQWLGAEFKRAGDDGQYLIFEISLPRKGRDSAPDPEVRIYARKSAPNLISIISVDVFDCHLVDLSHHAVPTLAALFAGRKARHRWQFREDFMLRRFATTGGGRALVDTEVVERPEPQPDPRGLPMAPQHADRGELLSELGASSTALERLGGRITTIGELASLSELELFGIETMGRKHGNELKEILARLDS